MLFKGFGSVSTNNAAASSMWLNTLSVMRSCNTCFTSFETSVIPFKVNKTPRSRRCTGVLQLAKISVAFDDQGEIVPTRGVTKI